MNETVQVALDALVIHVPLAAGLALIFVCARRFFATSEITRSNVAVLGVGALLCVAPTVLNLVIKFPGGGEISLIKKQIQIQSQQIKSDVGEQGAQLKSQIVEIKQQVAAAQKGTEIRPASLIAENKQNKGKVVVIFWSDGREKLAVKIEDYLLEKGYSANRIYTDFTELPDSARGPKGSISFVATEQDQHLQDEVENVLRKKFPEFTKVTETRAPKLHKLGIQIRLF